MNGSEPTERELVAGVRTGDQVAFRLLLGRYEAAALARIRHRLPVALRRKVDPEDILQDAYVVAAQRIGEFHGLHEGAFGLWLARIVEFRIRETLRFHLDAEKRDGHRETTRGARPDTRHFAGHRTTPSQALMADELRIRAERALERLPEHYSRVLLLVQHHGLSLRETGHHMERSYEATKKLYLRALARLRSLLEEESDHDARG